MAEENKSSTPTVKISGRVVSPRSVVATPPQKSEIEAQKVPRPIIVAPKKPEPSIRQGPRRPSFRAKRIPARITQLSPATFSFPVIKLPPVQIPKIKMNRRLALAAILAIIILFGLSKLLSKKPKSAATLTANKTTTQTNTAELKFDAVEPTGSKNNVKLVPFADRSGASYVDKIGTVQITVSQQPLPEKFKASPDAEIERLAKQYYATEKIVVDQTIAFLGNSEKGPQTVILQKNGLLIFIKSEKKIDTTAWAAYLATLQ